MPTVQPRKIRVAVADDHARVRAILADLVASTDDMVLVGAAADGRQAYDLIRRARPDVALMDVRMPEVSGIEVTRQLTDEGCHTRVLLHTAEACPSVVHQAVEAGAAGCLVKGGRAAAILLAVRVIDSGGTVWPATG